MLVESSRLLFLKADVCVIVQSVKEYWQFLLVESQISWQATSLLQALSLTFSYSIIYFKG